MKHYKMMLCIYCTNFPVLLTKMKAGEVSVFLLEKYITKLFI